MTNDLSYAEQERALYFEWLANRVGMEGSIPFSRLFKNLLDIPFMWQLDDDKNRAIDGNLLRSEYLYGRDINPEFIFPRANIVGENEYSGCTFLEFLVGLAVRANSIMYIPERDQTEDFFWLFMRNIGLDHCTDDMYGVTWDDFYVSECVGRVLSRSYCTDGTGGIFPLNNPLEDQTRVPIWYQMNAFLNENC